MAQFIKRSRFWTARLRWTDSAGKKHSKSKSGFKVKRDAQAWAAKAENKINQGVAIDKQISLANYYDRWIKTYKDKKLAQITLDRYKYTGEALRSFFGNIPIKNINRQHYQQFINKYGSNHAPDTVKKVNSIIHSCVKSAILDDYLTKNFTQRVELIANQDRVLNVDYLNLKEIKRLKTATMEGIKRRPGFTSRYMIITAIYTGMRLSEIQALTWNDIDWICQTISISKSWDMRTKQFKPAKSKSSNRTIKVNQQLLDCLKHLQQNNSTMVFMNQYGTIPTSNAVNKTLRQLLKKLHIHRKNFHFHSLRHSHVALLLANGVGIYGISKRLGHNDISTTTKVYAYLLDEYQNKVDQKIISALSSL
ncbi:tyrosine-type recombinase/integrase [Limosilactobacillus sp.]|uniref:site-specific integrase n=1 Tax=Limosilactobacillus sp. TaxID=2773925 RepID=UPI00345E33BB